MLTRSRSRRLLMGALAIAAASAVGGLRTVEAQDVGRPAGLFPRRVRHLRLIDPISGPIGTVIRFRTGGLSADMTVHIAIGDEGFGYDVVATVETDARGEMADTVTIKEGGWDQFAVVMILDEEFEPLAISDPFHIVDDAGLVRREGVVGTAWPGCPVLQSGAGPTYALVGGEALSLMASQGDEVIVVGRVVPGTCTLQTAIEVVRIELPPPGGP